MHSAQSTAQVNVSDQTDLSDMPAALIKAFESRSVYELEKIILDNPDVLCSKDSNNTNIIHYVLQFGDIALLDLVIEKLYKDFPSVANAILLASDSTGNTTLHYAARYANYEMFKFFLSYLDDNVFKLAKQINKDRRLPLELVNFNNSGRADEQKIRKKLEKATIDKKYKPIDELVNLEEIKDSLTDIEKSDSALMNNLQIATDAANSVRKMQIEATSHPYVNSVDPNIIRSLLEDMSNLRRKCDEQNSKLIPGTESYHVQELENICNEIKKMKKGNCSEYSLMVLGILKENNFQGFVELYGISDGNHAFVVIGRNPFSNPFDWRTWGRKSVVVDALGGEVYPASQLPTKLKAFLPYKTAKNYIAIYYPFNDQYHHLAPLYDHFILTPNNFNRLQYQNALLLTQQPNIALALKTGLICMVQIHVIVEKLTQIGDFDYKSLDISAENIASCDIDAILNQVIRVSNSCHPIVQTLTAVRQIFIERGVTDTMLFALNLRNKNAIKALMNPQILAAVETKKLDIRRDLNRLDKVSLNTLLTYVNSKLFQEKQLDWGAVQNGVISLWLNVMQYCIQQRRFFLTNKKASQLESHSQQAWELVLTRLSTVLDKLAREELSFEAMQVVIDTIASLKHGFPNNEEICLFLQKMNTYYLNCTLQSITNPRILLCSIEISMGYALLEAEKIFLESILNTDDLSVYNDIDDVGIIDNELYDALMRKERIEKIVELTSRGEMRFSILIEELSKTLLENDNDSTQHSLRWKNFATHRHLNIKLGFLANHWNEIFQEEDSRQLTPDPQPKTSNKRKLGY